MVLVVAVGGLARAFEGILQIHPPCKVDAASIREKALTGPPTKRMLVPDALLQTSKCCAPHSVMAFASCVKPRPSTNALFSRRTGSSNTCRSSLCFAEVAASSVSARTVTYTAVRCDDENGENGKG